jgi:subtilase family serine protease
MPLVSKRLKAAGAAGAAAALCAGAIAAAAPGRAATPRSAIPGTHPWWASGSARVSAQPVTTGTVSVRVYLAGQDPSGLAAYAQDVSQPGNADYGHFLSPAQVRAEFGPTSAQIAAVKSWLTGEGLTVTSVNDSVGGYVAVTGSVRDAAKAFSVTFQNFKGPDKRTDRAPAQPASAPAPVASAVLSVTGLDTAAHQMKPDDTLPPPGPNYWVAGPCSRYYAQQIATSEPSAYGKKQPWNNCGYTPRQVRGAYGVSASGMTGKGQTVAIVDAYASPTMRGDARQFANVVGDRPFRPGQYRQYLPGTFTRTAANACNPPVWYEEQTLDVEQVHAEAPDANVRYVAGASCTDQDMLTALAYIVDNHLASIVSGSWGDLSDVETLRSAYDELFEVGAVEGIGFFFSSGDDGYESPAENPASDKIQTDYPAESPWVTSVGGTSLAIGEAGNYQFETSWGTLLDPLAADGKSWQHAPPGVYPDGYDGSSGGGVSTVYTQPPYQRGVVPDSLAASVPGGATTTPMRVEPDVSALADPSMGVLIGQTTVQPDGTSLAFSLSRIGGTSVACPVFAAIQADAQQAAGHDLGFANPAIYQRYGTAAFNDVTDHPLGPGYLADVRNNYTDPSTKTGPLLTYLRTLGIDGEGTAALPAVKGYDDSTGVGSPKYYIQSYFGR